MTFALFMYSPQPAKTNAPLSFCWSVACESCHGYGWFTNDGYSEEYCTCEAARWRRQYDGAPLPWERDEP